MKAAFPGSGEKQYNIAGFAVFNGATDWKYDVSPSFPEVVYNFNLIPASLMKDFTDNGCVVYFNDFKPANGTDKCVGLWDQIGNLT